MAMAEFGRERRRERVRRRAAPAATLQVRDLHVHYGQSHALQGVALEFEEGAHAVVGRNGMGKTTLCNAIMGLLPMRRGSIRFEGEDITGFPPHRVAAMGVAYTPQGRRLWPSLTVDEHLRLADTGRGAWTVERIYDTFPRLAERRRNGGGQLSGGEQQMLAISRALLQDPSLLILDEPTEGLAPVIVSQLEALLSTLAEEGDVSILLIEQNIAVATAIARDVAIMVNGRISRVIPAPELARDRALQQRLIGVGRNFSEEEEEEANGAVSAVAPPEEERAVPATPESFLASLGGGESGGLPGQATEEEIHPGVAQSAETPTAPSSEDAPPSNLVYVPPTRWSSAEWRARASTDTPRPASSDAPSSPPTPLREVPPAASYRELPSHRPTADGGGEVLVIGTFDTKSEELGYIRQCLADAGLATRTVDLSTSGRPSSADFPPHLVAAQHPRGAGAVFTGERGASVAAMAEAFERWIGTRRDIGGAISAGGSGGTSLAAPGLRRLPVGVPKIMISTVASGEVSRYVGASDIMMMYSVTDVQGLNRISRRVLANGANALAGMVRPPEQKRGGGSDSSRRFRSAPRDPRSDDRPGLGLTMFGVTTTAIQQIVAQLEDRYDCLVFHATGVGGRSMEKLADSGLLAAAIDLTTTEICDMLMGGVFPADEDRFGAFIRTRIPWVGSVGALDMVNFGPPDTVPPLYRNRRFVEHNPQVTLMRTSPEENARMGEWIVDRVNRMTGPVRFLLPEGGVSALDVPGEPFHDPEADRALFDTIARNFEESASRRLVRTPHHVNDPAFTAAAVAALAEIHTLEGSRRHAAL